MVFDPNIIYSPIGMMLMSVFIPLFILLGIGFKMLISLFFQPTVDLFEHIMRRPKWLKRN